MNAEKNMIKERDFGVLESFKSRLLPEHYPSETFEMTCKNLEQICIWHR
jgi:hypothetical protein